MTITELKDKLQIKLIQDKSNMKEWCLSRGFNYSTFNQFINNLSTDREDYRKAVEDYLRGE